MSKRDLIDLTSQPSKEKKKKKNTNTKDNARHLIEEQLALPIDRSNYAVGQQIKSQALASCVPKIKFKGTDLKFPMTKAQVDLLRTELKKSKVGLGNEEKSTTAVDERARKSYEIVPEDMEIVNQDDYKRVVLHALNATKEGLDLEGVHNLKAHLYKLLIYEPGCYFNEHSDTERLPGMFGTMVIQLPSEYVLILS